jgi:ABC-type phosphate transport system substrate-binding protein
MRARLGRLIALFALCSAAAFAAGVPVANAEELFECGAATGSGSSLQANAERNVFIPQWPGKQCLKLPVLTYTATSSGRALKEWGAENGKFELAESGNGTTLDDWIGTDVAPEGPATTPGSQMFNIDEAGKSATGEPNGVLSVPVAQSAVEIVISLPTKCVLPGNTKHPQIEDKKLAEVWEEDKQTFSELLNTKLGLTGCTGIPSLQGRSKASGTTAGFKNFLSQVNPATWSKFVETAKKSESTEWPTAAKVNVSKNGTGEELANAVAGTPGTLGYVDQSDAVKAGFKSVPTETKNGKEAYYSFFAEIQNNKAAKEYASPAAGEESNCKAAEYATPAGKVADNVDWSRAKEKNSLLGETYPICTLTFVLDWQHYKFVFPSTAELQRHTVFEYQKWIVGFSALELGGQSSTLTKSLAKEHYGVLPKKIDEEAQAGVTEANVGL